MRLILIRHGEVEVPRPRTFYGGSEVPLSAAGRVEAARAAEALQTLRLDHVATSPLSRARFGAERVTEGRGLSAAAPELLDGLREIDRGRWVGLTAEEITARWPGDLQAHAADPETWRDHQGESLADLRERVVGARDRLHRDWHGGTVAVVAHLYPIRALVADALHRPYPDWERLRAPTGSITVMTSTPLGWVIEALGWKPEPGETLARLPLGL